MIVAIALLAALAVGCGPMQLAGNWTVNIAGTGGCAGTMGIRQTGSDFEGAWACGAAEGDVVGAVSGEDVSIRWTATGYRDVLLTAKAGDRTMSGTVNGSGFSGNSFFATRP